MNNYNKVVKTQMKSPGPLRIMAPSPSSQAQYNEFLREWASESIAMLRKLQT